MTLTISINHKEEEETNVPANEDHCQTEKKENLRKPINAVTEKKIEIFFSIRIFCKLLINYLSNEFIQQRCSLY
jgi:hypothetical protein